MKIASIVLEKAQSKHYKRKFPGFYYCTKPSSGLNTFKSGGFTRHNNSQRLERNAFGALTRGPCEKERAIKNNGIAHRS